MRAKRTKQYTKEELENALIVCDNDTDKMKEMLNLGSWSLRDQLDRNGLYEDKRKYSNKKRQIEIPDKNELEELYFTKNLTLLEIGKHYGVSNVTVKKWMVKYGVELLNHSQTISRKVVPKIIETNKIKYGVEHYYQSDKFKEKSYQTCMEKYGVGHYPLGNFSKAEIDVLNFFNSIHDGFSKSNELGIELDGYNPTLKVAFEYCGLYWHREELKGKQSHMKKYNICKENGIRLFTIFEDEWLNRNIQVKQFIQSSLNYNLINVFARKLTFKKLYKNDQSVMEFLSKYHIQGIPSLGTNICNYSLTDNDDIISVISVGKHHRNYNEVVISRCCTKSNISVVGGMQRLFKYIKSDYSNIKTWSDNRWTEGLLYQRLGFTLLKETSPDYSYVNLKGKVDGIVLRKSKQSMQKKYIGAGENQTEYERAIELGFDRIWDCGKKTWIFSQ